jgi:hypothetical protein
LRLMLLSKTLPAPRCFRVTFKTRFHSDAVVADLALDPASLGYTGEEALAIRLCTAGLDLRRYVPQDDVAARKMALVSSILEGSWPPLVPSTRVLGGVVGGNWDTRHRDATADDRLLDWAASHLGLKDAWASSRREQPAAQHAEDEQDIRDPAPDAELEPFLLQRRVERFLYTGRLHKVPLAEAQFVDPDSGVGQLGLGLETDDEVEAWWYAHPKRGGERRYVSGEVAQELEGWLKKRNEAITRGWTRVPVSSFPAIAVGVLVPG